MLRKALTFDDVNIVPQYSEVKSRRDCDTSQELLGMEFSSPIVPSNMATITGWKMAKVMHELGSIGIIHRFDGYKNELAQCQGKKIPFAASVGLQNYPWYEGVMSYGPEFVVIDVAHGHHKRVKKAVVHIKSKWPDLKIVAGNVATADGAAFLADCGVDGVKVGIGNGCFAPEMEVLTTKGKVQIKNINPGDYVYTHKGIPQKVLGTIIKEKNEDILVIDGIKCTKNHEFYAVHKKDVEKVTEFNLETYAKWVKAEYLTKDWFLVEQKP